MQTFLPFPDFEQTARVLDMKRLGKQRVEVTQILNALDGRLDKGWKNHPATRMWRGYPEALIRYGEAICTEWLSRGYRDSCLEKIREKRQHGLFVRDGTNETPPWLGDEALHRSHRRNLIRKDPAHYGPLFPDDTAADENEGYVWPV